MADYTQPDAVNKRVRFFDGQYLTDDDFVDEQKYHIDRARRLGRVLRVTGIADGLVVSSTQPNQVTVTAGTAIDAEGRQVVLTEDRTVALLGATFDDQTGVKLYVLYRELPSDLSTEGTEGHRRWYEDPQVVAVTTAGGSSEPWDDMQPAVLLAELRLDPRGNVTVDPSVAEPAGLRLPGDLDVQGFITFGAGTGVARLSASDWTFSLWDKSGTPRLTIQQDSGHVIIGPVTGPAGRLDVDEAEIAGQASLHLRSGDDWNGFGKTQVSFGWNGGTNHRHAIRTRHHSDQTAGNAIDFYVWDQEVDDDTETGTKHVMTLDAGNVGIGTTSPRTELDTGTGVMSGAANDYLKAQFALTGGGTVTWGGPGERLKWTQRFLATAMGRGDAISGGTVTILPPDADIPAAYVYDGQARSVDESGVLLNAWEALYAVHRVGGNHTDLDGFRITRWTHDLSAPSNWILVAVVNDEDRTVKLGTGVIVAARSSSSGGSPLPTGVILMWSGHVPSIPDGWALCDGSNGTPDLQSRFIVGAGPGGTPSYTANHGGEPDQHSHSVATPSTSLTTSSAGSHNHKPPPAWYDRSWHDYVAAKNKSWHGIDRGSGSVSSARTSSGGSHSHSLTLSGATFSSGTSTGNNRPKWYALCFIMKL